MGLPIREYRIAAVHQRFGGHGEFLKAQVRILLLTQNKH